MANYLKQHLKDVIISVYVQPGSKVSQLVGLHGDAIKIKVCALAEGNKANDEVRDFFKNLLDLPKSRIEIISGDKSRNKRIKIDGISADFVDEKLREFIKVI